MEMFASKEKDFLEIRKLAAKNKKMANYIKTICLFRISFLRRYEEDSSIYIKKIYKIENNSRKKNEKILNCFARVKEILMTMNERELERVLRFLNSCDQE